LLRTLDAQGGRVSLDDFIADLRAELSLQASMPLGIVATCFLGHPYEVHTLDPAGGIIQHYQTGEPLPGPLSNARTLAAHPAYEFVEVYPDRLLCVRGDGNVTEVTT
jgi:hypothetical protein